MKFNFKKISAIGVSVLLTGMTMGVAAAASYPAPFVVGGTANVAIVYGTGTGVSQLDSIQAGNIQTSLQSYMGGTTTVGGSSVIGESVLFESGTNKLNINDTLNSVKTIALKGTDLPTILKSGTYSNKENSDFNYDQKIEIDANVKYGHFADNDYLNKKPTLGIRIADDKPVLNYSLDFIKSAEDDTLSGNNLVDFEDTNIEILGKIYEITDAKNATKTKFTMMAGVEKGTLNYQETGTYTANGQTWDVTLSYVDSDECKFSVNGKETSKLLDGGTDKLSDGETLIGVTEVDYSVGATTEIMRCEFYIGANKLELEHDTDVEIDDVSISGLKAFFHETTGSTYKLDKIVIEWKADEDLFVAGDKELIMPGFGSVKFTSGGLVAPTGELIKVRGSSNEEVELTVPIKSGTATIQLLGSNETGGWDTIGGGGDNQRLATTTLNNSGAIGAGGANDLNIFYNLSTLGEGHQYFVATHQGTGAEGSSYLVEVASTHSTNGVDFRDYVTKENLATGVKNGTSFEIGDATFKLDNFVHKWGVRINVTGTTSYVDRVISKEGMVIYLPVLNTTTSPVPGMGVINLTTGFTNEDYELWMEEENKDGTLQAGTSINVTLGHTAGSNSYDTEAQFSSTADNVCSGGTDFKDPDNENYYICYTASDLGTKVDYYDSSSGADTVDITYYGKQVYGQIYLAETGAEVSAAATATTGSTSLGDILVKDSEVSSVSSKNLVIVGGSCINSAAAAALGVSQGTCGAAFTTATGVGSGEFLIKSVDGAFSTGKIALVVAGYEAADTVNAATYLRNQVVDTSKEYKGTSSTSATMVTTEA